VTTFKDLSGQTIASMKLTSFDRCEGGKSYWNCICSGCGKACQQTANHLKEAEKKGKISYCSLSCGYRTDARKDVGKTFNELTVLRINEERSITDRIIVVDAQCACGAIRSESLTKIRRGFAKACSATCKSMRDYKIEIGKKHGMLTIQSVGFPAFGEKYSGEIVFRCSCDCGGSHSAAARKVLIGDVSSCGCALDQYRADFNGANNPNWKNGATDASQIARSSQAYYDWRKSVCERDQMTCQHCRFVGPKDGSGMNAHHKYNFSTHEDIRYSVDNGVTFCRSCHIDFHAKYTNFKNTPEQVEEFISTYPSTQHSPSSDPTS
jgi:hypothetical protein